MAYVLGSILLLGLQIPVDDVRSREEVRARFEAFNGAWERRDMDFIRGFFAHDPEMLLFFERRQLQGWERVETLYENMFAHAREGSVTSTYSNLKMEARGSMAYVAANFQLQVTSPAGEVATDAGRVSVVFEKIDGHWRVVHRHTSFQAPPGPQRKVPLHTEPGPLWSPHLEGVWRSEEGALIVATASFVMTEGVTGAPGAGRYRVGEKEIRIVPEDGGPAATVELESLGAEELVLRLSSGLVRFGKVE